MEPLGSAQPDVIDLITTTDVDDSSSSMPSLVSSSGTVNLCSTTDVSSVSSRWGMVPIQADSMLDGQSPFASSAGGRSQSHPDSSLQSNSSLPSLANVSSTTTVSWPSDDSVLWPGNVVSVEVGAGHLLEDSNVTMVSDESLSSSQVDSFGGILPHLQISPGMLLLLGFC